MRRILLAAALALALHGLLFSVRFDGPKARLILPPRPITLSLAQAPDEPRPSLAAPVLPEPPDPPRLYRPPPREEKAPRQKARTPEKPSKNLDPSPLPYQEQAGPSSSSPGPAAVEAPVTATLHGFSAPPPTSLGDGQESRVKAVSEATPLYHQNPVPDYPLLGRKRGYQGTVMIDVLVSREGTVSDLRLSTSSGYTILDEAALMSVKTWLFHPGMRGEEKVDMWVKVPVRFRLE